VTDSVHDNLGRETAEDWLDSSGNVTHSFSYAYDADGELLSAADNDPTNGSTDTFAYDAVGQVTTETQAVDGLTPVVILARQYDADGNQTQLSASIGSSADFVNSYSYDNLGQMTRVTQSGVSGGDAVAEKRVDFTYDADGQFSTIARYNALSGGSGNEVATSTYGYDNAGRLTSLTHAHGTATLAGYQFQYDAADNLTEMKSSADATTGNAWGVVDYTYDNTNQLKTATYTTFANAPANEDYSYDANGNQDTGGNTVQSTGDNRLATDAAGYNYLYDADGNEIAKYQGSAPVDNQIPSDATDITTYTWDYRNRLSEVDSFANDADYLSGTKTQAVTYAYDAFNRLVKETVTAGSTVTQEAFAYDGTNAVLEFQKTGSGSLAASDLSGTENGTGPI
jgi:YD repeat-containing protein